ncbi:MAG TPA: hypothetical protein PKD38_18665 [Nitrospira sp.]|nr:hypothetical protein [Nitrospira sp.]
MALAALPFDPTEKPLHPEPVPGATQLAALPFSAAVVGCLEHHGVKDKNRVVLHRTVTREGGEYLQQVSSYVGSGYDPRQAGRMNAVTTGIIGKAYALQKILRTRHYPSSKALLEDLRKDMDEIKDKRPIASVARSYLAVPMISSTGSIVSVFYADTFTVNAFANDGLVKCIVEMCRGFCGIMDELARIPLPGIKNYELTPGKPVEDLATVYPRLQRVLEDWEIPRFNHMSYLNLEAGS